MQRIIEAVLFISWCFGIFPSILPFFSSSYFRFSPWRNPNFIWSLVILFANGLKMIDGFLTVSRAFPSEHITVLLVIFVGNGMALLADAIIRVSSFWNCGRIIEFFQSLQSLRENVGRIKSRMVWSFARKAIKSNNNSDEISYSSESSRGGRIKMTCAHKCWITWLNLLLMAGYVVPRSFWSVMSRVMDSRDLRYSVVFKENVDVFWGCFVKGLLCFLELTHHATMFFAYAFVLLFGQELTDRFEEICEILCHHNVDGRREYDPDHGQYRSHNGLLTASSGSQSAKGVEVDDDALNFDLEKLRHQRFVQLDLAHDDHDHDGKHDLAGEFRKLKNCFGFYSKLAGILILAISLKMVQDIFTMLSYLIVANQKKISKIAWALSSSLLFIQIINLGEGLQTKITKWKDRILHSLLQGKEKDLTSLQQERKEAAVEILGWNWNFTAMNLFTVNRRLLPGVIAMILSNIILIYQMKISDSSSQLKSNSTCSC